VTTGIVKALKFSFLLVSDEYFHGEQHDLLLPKNQASSMITGIYAFVIIAGHAVGCDALWL
ncbi:hypothetical protein, partial [Salmonella enterica]|uniref:hypothetical protein n=1 Tax=Salmonella enterica TaxID=28901 RepID=UPI001E637286